MYDYLHMYAMPFSHFIRMEARRYIRFQQYTDNPFEDSFKVPVFPTGFKHAVSVAEQQLQEATEATDADILAILRHEYDLATAADMDTVARTEEFVRNRDRMRERVLAWAPTAPRTQELRGQLLSELNPTSLYVTALLRPKPPTADHVAERRASMISQATARLEDARNSYAAAMAAYEHDVAFVTELEASLAEYETQETTP